jgi:hypothetical protein
LDLVSEVFHMKEPSRVPLELFAKVGDGMRG